jgi:hypothetical protein
MTKDRFLGGCFVLFVIYAVLCRGMDFEIGGRRIPSVMFAAMMLLTGLGMCLIAWVLIPTPPANKPRRKELEKLRFRPKQDL